MDDWLRNMGDWCISRKRYWGLPLPFYLCAVRQADGGRARWPSCASAAVDPGLDGLQELHRPWIDGVQIRCTECDGEIAERVPRSATAGSTPASCRSRRSAGARRVRARGGYAKGAGEGLTKADLPDHAYWEKWFPADWVSEMREQIRLWFYSQLFMSVVLDGQGAVPARCSAYEKLNDETGRPMHKSWGNAIWFDDAVEKMGADVMRWLFARPEPGPEHELRLRAGDRGQARAC